MKAILVFILAATVVAVVPISFRDDRVEDKHSDDLWVEFKNRFNKTYRSIVEDNFRKFVFIGNQRKIMEHNRKYEQGFTTYKIKMNQFGDMSYDEYKYYMLGSNQTLLNITRTLRFKIFQPQLNESEIASHVDWRTQGAVTPVQDQGLVCGSCWAFAATGALEGQYFRKTGVLTALSAQSLIDCTGEYGNLGCGGGSAVLSFQFTADRQGLESEARYPYVGRTGECPYKFNDDDGEEDENLEASFIYVEEADERALKVAVAQVGPLSTAIDGLHDTFRFYSEGIYDQPECSQNDRDHAVLVIGYGTDSQNRDYWLVKNSWGTSWGQAGYFKIARNRHNHCGIASVATYPLL